MTPSTHCRMLCSLLVSFLTVSYPQTPLFSLIHKLSSSLPSHPSQTVWQSVAGHTALSRTQQAGPTLPDSQAQDVVFMRQKWLRLFVSLISAPSGRWAGLGGLCMLLIRPTTPGRGPAGWSGRSPCPAGLMDLV